MSHTTQGTLLLDRLGIAYTLHPYDYDPDAPRIGLHAAESLGIDPSQTFKTLMAEVDGKPVCVVVPSDTEVSMKKLAATFGGKSAAMMKVPDAERLTGLQTVAGHRPVALLEDVERKDDARAKDRVKGEERDLHAPTVSLAR